MLEPIPGRRGGLTANSSLKAVVFDPYPLYLDAVITLLNARSIEVVAATTVPSDAIAAIDSHAPELFVARLDTASDDLNGIGLIREATSRSRSLKVIVLSDGEGEKIDQAFAAGASAYVTTEASPDDIAVAIRQTFEHSIHLATDWQRSEPTVAERAGLTPREVEVLALVGEGYSNAELARLLRVTPPTVKFHLSNVYRKLNVSNRTQASRLAPPGNLAANREAERIAEVSQQ